MPVEQIFREIQGRLVQHGFMLESDVRELSPSDTPSPALVEAITNFDHVIGGNSASELMDGRLLRDINDRWMQNITDALSRPRCGIPTGSMSGVHILTFGSPGERWSRGMLTFSVNAAGSNLSANVINSTISSAFVQWQAVSPFFNFTQVGANGDIQISFGGAELDSDFGTPSGVLATGAYPELGRLNFDSAETWTAGRLLSVALHEIGHILGLSHSNNRASVMYPYDMSMLVIDGETRDALRNLYGWRPQIQLGDRATSDRPALAVTSNVTFTWSTLDLHMVWKGTGDDQGIYEAELINNVWTPQRRIDGIGSSQSPALASIPLGNGTPSTGLIMAWKGVNGDQGIYYATKGVGGWTRQQRVSGVGTSHRPALANFNGIRMVWKGVNGDQGIYWSTLTPGGWAPQQNIRGVGTSASPALVTFRNRLYMFWKGIEGDQQVYYSWLDDGLGAIWQPQRVVAYADYETGGGVWSSIGGTNGPSVTVRGDRILLAWKGVEGDQGIYFSLFDGNEFTGQIRVNRVGTSQGPGVCTIGDFTHMAWKGVEGDSTIYWSTL